MMKQTRVTNFQNQTPTERGQEGPLPFEQRPFRHLVIRNSLGIWEFGYFVIKPLC
jgi:hypothetical protein